MIELNKFAELLNTAETAELLNPEDLANIKGIVLEIKEELDA